MAMDFDQIDAILNMLDAKDLGAEVSEKRTNERRSTDLKVRFLTKKASGEFIEDANKNIHPAKLVNVSTTGVGLVTRTLFYVGDALVCETHGVSVHFQAELKVVHYNRVKDGFYYGCRFARVHQIKAKN